MHRHKISWLYTSKQPFTPAHIAYMAFCVVLLDYAHDAWFYWTHRLLHQGWLYRHVHCVHHKCGLRCIWMFARVAMTRAFVEALAAWNGLCTWHTWRATHL
jgi:sterol desaturase/sphingolipid hydroxylase (fatty acid hydroxylase superfamily)